MQKVSTYNPHGYNTLQAVTFIMWLTAITSMDISPFIYESSSTGSILQHKRWLLKTLSVLNNCLKLLTSLKCQTQPDSAYSITSLPINFFLTVSTSVSLLSFVFCLRLFAHCPPFPISHLPPDSLNSFLLGLKWLQMSFRWLLKWHQKSFPVHLTLDTIPMSSFIFHSHFASIYNN